METSLGQLAYLKRRIHDPDRLAILTALSECEQADFQFLQRITGLAEGKFFLPLSKLERAGWVEVERRFVETRSLVRLSDDGRQAIESYRAEEGFPPRERRPPAPTEPDVAEGRSTRFGLTVYQGGRMKRSDR